MPIYVYFCDQCDLEFEVVQKMKDLSLANCVICDNISKNRIPQVFSAINKTPNTLGSLADMNRSNMSDAHYQETVQNMANDRRKMTTYKGFVPEGAEVLEKKVSERPFYRKDRDTADIGLTKMNTEQINKYVMEGKRPIGV